MIRARCVLARARGNGFRVIYYSRVMNLLTSQQIIGVCVCVCYLVSIWWNVNEMRDYRGNFFSRFGCHVDLSDCEHWICALHCHVRKINFHSQFTAYKSSVPSRTPTRSCDPNGSAPRIRSKLFIAEQQNNFRFYETVRRIQWMWYWFHIYCVMWPESIGKSVGHGSSKHSHNATDLWQSNGHDMCTV